jgi:hypothetical protein
MMRPSVDYQTAWNEAMEDIPAMGNFSRNNWTAAKRGMVTKAALAAVTGVTAAAWWIDNKYRTPHFATVALIDALLLAILVLFRLFKECVTPRSIERAQVAGT